MTTLQLLKIGVLSADASAGLVKVSAQEWIGQAYPPSTQCTPEPYDPKSADYESWIRGYQNGPLSGGFGNSKHVELTITVIDGDNLKPPDNYPLSCGVTTSFSVSSDRTVSVTSITPGAMQDWKSTRLN